MKQLTHWYSVKLKNSNHELRDDDCKSIKLAICSSWRINNQQIPIFIWIKPYSTSEIKFSLDVPKRTHIEFLHENFCCIKKIKKLPAYFNTTINELIKANDLRIVEKFNDARYYWHIIYSNKVSQIDTLLLWELNRLYNAYV